MAAPATIELTSKPDSLNRVRVATVAWILTAVYYFFQYALRSAPAVMMPELSNALISSPRAWLLLLVCFITVIRHSA